MVEGDGPSGERMLGASLGDVNAGNDARAKSLLALPTTRSLSLRSKILFLNWPCARSHIPLSRMLCNSLPWWRTKGHELDLSGRGENVSLEDVLRGAVDN